MVTPSLGQAPGSRCPTCGAAAHGNFCPQCGTPLAPQPCRACGAELGAGARFCHRCGAPAGAAAAPARAGGGAGSDRTAWLVALAIIIVALGAIIWRVAGPRPPVPAGGGVGAAAAAPAGTAPDISQMTPLERFIRLNDRIMTALETGDTATARNFLPMALAAYDQLPDADTDARYHAGLLRAQAGDLAGARAVADTILRAEPGNLIGLTLLDTIGELGGDPALRTEARRRFTAAWDAEIAKPNPEYRDHRNVLDAFRAGGGG